MYSVPVASEAQIKQLFGRRFGFDKDVPENIAYFPMFEIFYFVSLFLYRLVKYVFIILAHISSWGSFSQFLNSYKSKAEDFKQISARIDAALGVVQS